MRPLLQSGCVLLAALIPAIAAADEDSSAWQLPPLDWGGATSYNVSTSRAPGNPTQALRQSMTQTLEGTSYLYAPWLVGVSGTLNVTKALDGGRDNGGSYMLTGGGTLSILPRSQYPVEITYNRFNSSVNSGTDLSEISGDTLKLQSRAFVWDNAVVSTNLSLSNTQSDDGYLEHYKEADVSMNKTFDKDEINLRLTYRDRDFTQPDHTTELGRSSSLQWRYRSVPFLDVTTDSVTTVQSSTLDSRSFSERNLILQGVSTALWRPKELPELTVAGAMRTYSQNGNGRDERAGTELSNTFQTIFTDLSASYLFRPRLIGNIGVNGGYEVQKQLNDGIDLNTRSISSGGRANLGYNSLTDQIMGFEWSWNTSTNASLQNGTNGQQHSETVNFGHSVRRQIELPFLDDPFSLSVSEGVTTGYTDRGYALGLSHAASLGRSTREGKHWDYIQGSVSDTRAFGTEGTEGQLVNIQFTRGYDPDRFTSLSGSITYQISRFTAAGGEAFHSDSLGGNITFRQQNVFGLERLNFTSDLSLEPPSLFRSERSFYGSFSSGTSQLDYGFGTQRWTNRLDYTIGKLRTSLIGRVINAPNGLGESLFFQVTRAF